MWRALVLVALAGCDDVLGLASFEPRSSYASAVLADRPIAYLPLDEVAGTQAHDEIQTGPVGLLQGNVTLGTPPPFTAAGHAMQFDGIAGAVDLGNSFSFAGRAPFSVEAWVAPSAPVDGYDSIVAKLANSSGQAGWALFGADASSGSSGSPRFLLERLGPSSGLFAVTAYDATKSSGWYYVVGTYDGGIQNLFLDGRAAGPGTGDVEIEETNVSLVIGAVSVNDAVFSGAIAQVAIYDYALTPLQVADHYAAASD